MPQKQTQSKKKKKGHAPAHQNKFAFRHNPKSKLTAKIADMPNQYVCRRCHDKIEWRKQYRKYKPRTQPGTCNFCRKRNVLAAYHTICQACTTSDKARRVLKGENLAITESSTKEEEPKRAVSNTNDDRIRICAICAKEKALPDPTEEEEISEIISKLGPMSLRQKRTIERQLRKEREEEKKTNESSSDDEHDPHDEKEDSGDDDDDDELVKAVGGADKLLTGEDYQKMLLDKRGKITPS